MRKIRLKPTESYCQKYLYTKIMTSKCKIIKYKLNANIFFQIYFCSTFSVRIQKVKINWKGRRLFERRHSKNTIWCESTRNCSETPYWRETKDQHHITLVAGISAACTSIRPMLISTRKKLDDDLEKIFFF